ncbi:unnamed protein product [Gongylonema pulchrum]|uniref:Uncharacterized protein n=1 Tax=Gongylonema pulchrum TaxID=637853 RepID=A0A183D2G4_9BILA|nr:unnamed protein product [Gongylonema pulchrum]
MFGTTVPMPANGQAPGNGRLPHGIRRSSSSSSTLRATKQQQPQRQQQQQQQSQQQQEQALIKPRKSMEPKAPIAQAECSDTDYDTARSLCRPVSIDKAKSSDTITTVENRYSRERAQSAETRPNGMVFVKQPPTKIRPRHRSQHRGSGIFASFRKSTKNSTAPQNG